MAKSAIFIQIFPSSILAFIFLCSITILADPKPPDPDIPIAIENGKNGNLGEWEHFVQQAYQISSQCYRVPEQDKIFSNRLHVRCKNEPQADGASLLVCYPSVLDSDLEAFPDEDDEGLTPALQPTMMESITVDPKSNIIIECNELMEKCKSTPKCPMPKMAKKWGEKWHGFRVTRRRGGFQIELPFGNGDGNDTKIYVPDMKSEHPQFFINFAKEANLNTEIIHGSSSNPRENKEKYTVVDEKERQKLGNYIKARKWGIDLNDVKGLWMLAMDILPVEEKQLFKKGNVSEIDEPMIRWFTKSKPAFGITEECVEKSEKLGIKITNTTYYISAQYLTPSAADPQNDDFFTNGQKQWQNEQIDPDKIIEVKENKSHIEKIEHQILDGTAIRIRAQSTKGKFAIKLLIGFEREYDYLGERIFIIYVDFKKIKPMDQCFVMDVNKNKLSCNNEVNPFLRTYGIGKPFWFQMEFKGGTEIHFNFDCTELIVPVEKIPYNPDAYIKFEGELKLFTVEKEKVINITKKGNEMDEKFPILTITNLNNSLIDDNVLYISGSTRKDSKIKITLVQLDGDEQKGKMSLFGIIEVNVTKEGEISAKMKDENNLLTVCLVQNQQRNDKSIFVLLSRNDENKHLLTINGRQTTCEKNISNFNYVQVSGDILMNDSPMFLTNLAEKYRSSIMFDTEILGNNSFLNFVLIIFENYPSAVGEKITIYLDCPSCEQDNSIILLLIDLNGKNLIVTYYKWTLFFPGFPNSAGEWKPVFVNIKLPTDCTIGQPIWFTIKQEQQGENDANYKVIINGENSIDIKIKDDTKLLNYPYVEGIHMEGNVFLFNKIIPFPLMHRMKNRIADKLPENFKIIVKGMVMPNAEWLQFALVTNEKEGKLFLHVRVNQKINEICIGKLYNKQDGPCTATIHEKSPFINGKPFLIEFSGKQWNNGSLSVQINEENFEVERGDFDAEYLLLHGDMVLFDSPKCEPECPKKQKP